MMKYAFRTTGVPDRSNFVGMATDTRRGGRMQEHHMKQVSLSLIMVLTMVGVVMTVAHGQQTRSGSHAEVVASAFSAEVTGTVKNVNQKSGKLVLETADGPVNVVFPGSRSGGQVRRPDHGLCCLDQAPALDFSADVAPNEVAGIRRPNPLPRQRVGRAGLHDLASCVSSPFGGSPQ
jgi:hypothetical protein